jgi:tetratricopeptide (TPR) repeat protein
LLERAVTRFPDDPEGYALLGDLCLQEWRWTAASLLYVRASELLPNLVSGERKLKTELRIARGLAAVAAAREQWTEARALLEKLVVLLPNNQEHMAARSQALQRLGEALFQLGRRENDPQKANDYVKAAEEKLLAAHEADENGALAPEAALALLYEQCGDHQNAEHWIRLALTKAPEDLRTRLAVGRWALERHQTDEALKHAKKALQLDPQSLDAMVLRGWVAVWQEDYATAEKYFEDALAQAPDNLIASKGLALALSEQKDRKKKARALSLALSNRQRPACPEYASSGSLRVYGRNDAVKRPAFPSPYGDDADSAYVVARILIDREDDYGAKRLLRAALLSAEPFTRREQALTQLAALELQAQEHLLAGDMVVVVAVGVELRGEKGSTARLPVGVRLKVLEVCDGLVRVELDEPRRGTVPRKAVLKP